VGPSFGLDAWMLITRQRITGDPHRNLRIKPDGLKNAFDSGVLSFEIDVIENLPPALKASR
jgi:hypothetical protein